MARIKRVPKNARILKKIHLRVKMKEIAGTYVIYARKTPAEDWHAIYRSRSISRALHRKHNEYLHVIGNLGYRVFLLDRRKHRRNAKPRKNLKRT